MLNWAVVVDPSSKQEAVGILVCSPGFKVYSVAVKSSPGVGIG